MLWASLDGNETAQRGTRATPSGERPSRQGGLRMTLRLRKWVSRLLNLSAGVFLCASIGCKSTGADRAPTGPTLPPVKTMGPGNQVSNDVKSPAFANIQGQGPALNNGMPPMQGNQQGVMYGGNPNAQMQGMQLPPMNQGNPAYGQQNQQVTPSQFGQQQPVQQFGQQQPVSQQPPVQPLPINQPPASQQTPQLQPPLLQQQGPALSTPPGRLPTSMDENLRIPDSPPNVREIVAPSGAGLMQVNHESPAPMMLEPKPTMPLMVPAIRPTTRTSR